MLDPSIERRVIPKRKLIKKPANKCWDIVKKIAKRLCDTKKIEE